MNRFITGSALLSLACLAGAANVQADAGQSVDTLYEQGPRQLASSWRGLGKTHGAAVFIHNDIRKTDNARLAVWTHHELPAPEYFEKEKAYLSTRERMVVDCKNAKVGASDISYYAQRFGKGEIVGSERMKKTDVTDVVPDSIEEQLVKAVCAPKPRRAPARKAKTPKQTDS